MNDHVAKPIDVDTFFATLAKWLPVKGDRVKGLPRDVDIQIDGLATKEGLYRVAGNVELYTELLGSFATQQRELLTGIRQALRGEIWPGPKG